MSIEKLVIFSEERTRRFAQLWHQTMDKIVAEKGGVPPVLVSILPSYASDGESRIEFCFKYPNTNWAHFVGIYVREDTDEQICEQAVEAAHEWINSFNAEEVQKRIEKYSSWPTKYETHEWCKR